MYNKGESRVKNLCKVRVLNFLIRYFSNYYTLHRSDLAVRAAPLDPRLSKPFNQTLRTQELEKSESAYSWFLYILVSLAFIKKNIIF